jgi:hypothetical protein
MARANIDLDKQLLDTVVLLKERKQVGCQIGDDNRAS